MKMILAAFASVCLLVAVTDFLWVISRESAAPVSPAPAVDPIEERSLEIAVEVEGIAEANPENRHLLSALFLTSGSMEIVMALPPHSEWVELSPPCGPPMRDEIAAEIAAAIGRGAMQFQLTTMPHDRGAVVER